jgi:hypothetical protein
MAPMASKLRAFSWNRYFAYIFIISIAFSAVYYLYCERQKELHSRFLFHLLSSAAQNIGETIGELQGNVNNAINSSSRTEAGIKSQLALIPYLDTKTFAFEPAKENAKQERPSVTKTAVSIDSHDSICVLKFVAQLPEASIQINGNITDIFNSSLPEDVYNVFEGGVVFARGDNEEVLLQNSSSVLQIMRLPREKASKEGNEAAASQEYPAITQIREIEIAGRKYKLFLQPFHIPLEAGREIPGLNGSDKKNSEGNYNDYPPQSWLLGGLIPSSAYWAKTMAVRAEYLIFSLTFLMIILLAVPFIHIRFIGLREKLKAHDVYVLMLSLFVGCSLVVLAFSCCLNYLSEVAAQDANLHSTALNITEKFGTEANRLQNELVRLSRLVSRYKSPQNPNPILQENILNDPDRAFKYPLFEMAFGVGEDGWQKWKWSVKKTPTPILYIPDRQYFINARNYKLPFFSFGRNGESEIGRNFSSGRYIESTRSKNTSEVFAILSLRLKEKDAAESIVPVIQARLLSLIDPVLPPGYNFAIIDRKGMVQFHSYKGWNLRENFFEEVDRKEEMNALVVAGADKSIEFSYKAAPQRAWITPFNGTPWTLVVFTDNSDIVHRNLESLTFSMMLYGLLLLLVFLSFMLVHHLGSRNAETGETRRMWFWPDRTKMPQYHRLLFMMGILIVFWLIASFLSPTIIAIWNLIYPLILIAGLYWWLCRPAHGLKATRACPSSGRLKWTYIALMSGLFFNIAILPAFAFYEALHKEECLAYTKKHQVEMAQLLRKRVEKHLDRYRTISLSSENRKKIQKELALMNENNCVQNAPDVYANDSSIIEFPNMSFPSGEQPKENLISFLSGMPFLPHYNSITVASRVLSDPGIIDKGKWVFTRKPGHLTMIIPNFRPAVVLGNVSNRAGIDPSIDNPEPVGLQIDTAMNDYRPNYSKGLIVFLVVGSLALVWMIAAIMRVVFIIDFRFPLSLNSKNTAERTNPEWQIHIRLAELEPKSAPHRLTLGIREIRDAPSVHSLLSRALTSSKTEIVLDDFDCGLDEQDVAQKKLDLLEGLVQFSGYRIILKTSIDPLYYLSSRAHDFWQDKNEKQIPLCRWAVVLQKFVKLRDQATEDECGIRKAEFRIRLRENGGLDNLPEKVQQSLIDEGWPTRFMQDLAIGLATREELGKHTAGDVVDRMLDLADAQYRRIWSSCSTDEKMLLFMLAYEGLINWQLKDTVRHLIRRRIVIVGPNFRFMNESFRQFVLRAERPEVFRNWEDAVEASTWSKLRVPIFLSACALAAFFFITQKDIFTTTLGMLAGVTAGLPVLAKFFGLFARDWKSSSTEEG